MMFISKFNALIRNRWFWGAFAFLVVISFIGWGTTTSGGREDVQKVGELNGKAISQYEFQDAWFDAYLSASLMFGQSFRVNEKTEAMLKKMAWRRLAAERAARAAGFSVGDDEVAGVIRQQPQFQNNGQFDPARYQAFINNFLQGSRITPAQFERYLRNEILIHKARQMIAAASWVAPSELLDVFHQLYDELTVGYAVIRDSDLTYVPEVAEKDARAYFEAHRTDFKIPEKVRVQYVCLPFSNYVGEAVQDDASLKAYYDEHIEEFTVRDTNDWQTALPFEEVKGRIREELARVRGREIAQEKAADLEVALAPDRAGKAPSFAEAAAAAGLAVRTTEFFAVAEKIPGLDVGLDFNRAAFDLRLTPDDYFSRPIAGSNAVYLLALDERRDARLPEFDEVRAEVLAAARRRVAADELARLAREIHAAAETALRQNKTLEPVFAKYGVEFVMVEPFAVQTGLEGVMQDVDDEFQYLLRELLTCPTGRMTDLVKVPDGYALAVVRDRRPADAALLASVRAELVGYLRRRRNEMVFECWQDYLLADAKMENLARASVANDAEDEDDPGAADADAASTETDS